VPLNTEIRHDEPYPASGSLVSLASQFFLLLTPDCSPHLGDTSSSLARSEWPIMSSSHSVQLGAFHIDLDKGHDFPFTDNEWLELDLQILRSGIWLSHERRIIETLRFALADEGLGFSATCRRQVDQLVVRVALLPSDAPGSRWKRVKSWDRRKYLERLFLRLRKGYDGWGDPLMGRTVCFVLRVWTRGS